MQAIDSSTGRAAPKDAGPDGTDRGPDPLRSLAVVCVVFFALGLVGVFGNAAWQYSKEAAPGQSIPNDLSVFWAAAKIGLEGPPAAAFDKSTLTAARNLDPDLPPVAFRMTWVYPPQFHALILPLGLVPFLAAWIAFAAVGIGAFWLAVARLVPDGRSVTVACASPAVMMCAIQGQNSLIVGALLAGLLVALRAGRPVTAGVLLGALTIKPQFGPLLPLALVAARAWRAIGWGALTAAVVVALTLAWAGPEYWRAFLDSLAVASERMTSGWLPRHLMVSWYAFALGAGAPKETAMAVQVAAMALLAAAVGWAWLGGRGTFALRGALLSVAVVLFSPYVYFYDLVLPMIGVALVLASGRVRRGFAGVALGVATALVWALPTFGHFAKEAGIDYAFALLGPPVLTLFLLLILRELALARPGAHA